MENPTSTVSVTQKIIGSFIAGVLVGALLFWLADSLADNSYNKTNKKKTSEKTSVLSGEEKNDSVALEKDSSEASSVPANDSDEVVVENQSSGDSVTVKLVQLSRPGWVAVHEDRSGQPGNILGAVWYPEGIHLGFVSLLRNTTPGGKYYVMLHNDDGDRKFDYTKDLPLSDSSYKPVMMVFEAL